MRTLAFVTLLLATAPALADVAPPTPTPVTATASSIAPCPAGDVTNTQAALADGGDDGSLQSRLKHAVASGNLGLALVLVLLGGLLTALSPCVYPLIPITLSILGARSAASKLGGFLLASTYVSGMVILYSALGVGFAAAGFLAGSALQSPVVTIGVAVFCLVMASSMFGAFEFALPSSLQTRLSQAGGGGFKGAFIMGLVAGIIAAPCTGPVLSFILTLIARDGSIAKGALLMFVYALGMGLPFLVLGTFSQAIASIPKSGKWMEVVKSIFGMLMVGAALYYLRIAIPVVADLFTHLGDSAFLGPILIIAGVAVGALHLSFKHSPTSEKARKAVGVVFAIAGVAAFIGWATSSNEAPTGTAAPIAWTIIKGEADGPAKVDAALEGAKKACKPAMIDFFAEWCIACKELDKKTYVDDAVRKEAQRFVAIKVDSTKDSDALKSLLAKFKVGGLPRVLFIDSRGNVLENPDVQGFVEAPDYLALMKRVR